MNEYETWLGNELIPNDLKETLLNMNEEEVEQAFCQNLEFGTGGLRGLLGPGINRLNIFTIRKVTLGLANYLKDLYPNQNIAVAIGYDSRHKSKEFSEEVAKVLADFEIKTYIFDDVKPTPLLSFLVREQKCQAGIMITASHNPKEYNGYKVYNDMGAQLNLDQSSKMIKYVNQITDVFKFVPNNDYHSFVTYISPEFDQTYIDSINDLPYTTDIDKNIKIVFSPEHGTSYKIMPRTLNHFGYNNIILVEEQCTIDPDFSHTKSSNPEELIAYELAVEYAEKHTADLIIVNDSDADRLGIMYRDTNGVFKPLSGNETGTLMVDYILNNTSCLTNAAIYKTIVTGEMGAIIAKNFNVEVIETLTGFKFIGEQINNNEVLQKDINYLFGYEDSYGYLIKPVCRDKDAIQSGVLIAEIVGFYKNKGLNLGQKLDQLYDEYGYFNEVTHAISLSGIDGLEKIKKVMEYYRVEQIKKFKDVIVTNKIDYDKDQIGLPKANVIKFNLENGGWVVFRPSGTEPKLKIYVSVKASSKNKAAALGEDIYAIIRELINTL